jgi:hypothetical protein
VEKRGRNERGYLDGDGGVVGGVGLEHHFVVGDHHDVGLDLLGDALGPRRRQVEPHRARPRRQQRQRRGGKSQQKSPRGRRHCPRPPDLAALLRSRATRGSLDWTFFYTSLDWTSGESRSNGLREGSRSRGEETGTQRGGLGILGMSGGVHKKKFPRHVMRDTGGGSPGHGLEWVLVGNGGARQRSLVYAK